MVEIKVRSLAPTVNPGLDLGKRLEHQELRERAIRIRLTLLTRPRKHKIQYKHLQLLLLQLPLLLRLLLLLLLLSLALQPLHPSQLLLPLLVQTCRDWRSRVGPLLLLSLRLLLLTLQMPLQIQLSLVPLLLF